VRLQHSWSQNHILPAIKFEEIIDIDMEGRRRRRSQSPWNLSSPGRETDTQ
jgi:hypothetical protein